MKGASTQRITGWRDGTSREIVWLGIALDTLTPVA
jgi:hypothetical protein